MLVENGGAHQDQDDASRHFGAPPNDRTQRSTGHDAQRHHGECAQADNTGNDGDVDAVRRGGRSPATATAVSAASVAAKSFAI